MKLSEPSVVSSFGPSPGLHLGLTGRSRLSIRKSWAELDTFMPTTFVPYIPVIPTTVLFSLFKNFAIVLQTYLLKNVNKKTTTRLSQKFDCFSFP